MAYLSIRPNILPSTPFKWKAENIRMQISIYRLIVWYGVIWYGMCDMYLLKPRIHCIVLWRHDTWRHDQLTSFHCTMQQHRLLDVISTIWPSVRLLVHLLSVSSWWTSAACMDASQIMTGMSKGRCLVSSPLKTLVREISGSAFVTEATWNQTEVFSSAQNISMKSLCVEMTSSPVWVRSWPQYSPPGFMIKNHHAKL